MKTAPLLLALLVLSLTPTLAGDPFATAEEVRKNSPPTQAAFIFEWIEVDHRQANKLIRKHADEPSAKKLRKQLGKMIEAKQAELVQTAYLHTRQQERSKTEAIDEHTYPTEFDPAEIPQAIERHMRDGELIITPAKPTAFDVRDVGTIIEIEPTIKKDGKTIELNLRPEIVKHLCDRGVAGNSKTVPKALAPIEHPAFYVMKLQTTITVSADDSTLAGIFTPPGEADKRILLIVHAKLSN